ncbi:MAG: methyltransferase domain-containing protein [Rhodospirillales bacterium]|nr:methyltransferase domain-containing protein [Rhodospirillales bacterium]
MTGRIESHYASDGIAARLLGALRAAKGADAAATPEALAPLDHFHNRGVVATRETLALLDPRPDDHVLDIGCGIGGPARWIAKAAGCRVTGVDLVPEFAAAGRELCTATGQLDRVDIRVGDALALPFADATFDRAYSQNVAMNISDKVAMYREALRVLKPGGIFVLSNLGAGLAGPPHYPTPWAADAAASFLSTAGETRHDLEAAGFAIVSLADTTAHTRDTLAAMRAKMAANGRPALFTHVLMGERMWLYQDNVFRSLDEGRLSSIEAVARRPQNL